MQDINDIISQMPNIPRRPKPQTTAQDQAGMIVNQAIPAILQFIAKELPIKKDFSDSQALHNRLVDLIANLQELIEANDTPKFTEEVKNSINDLVEKLGDLVTKLSEPIVNITLPTDAINAVELAVKSIKFPSDLSINNLGDVTRSINELKPLISSLKTSIEDSSVEVSEDVVLDKESKSYLKNLEFLNTDAKNPLSVRISDGKEFIKGLGTAVGEQVKILGGGGSTSSFKDSGGSSQKALLDSNSIAKVTQDNYTVKIVYLSAGLPQYIGKALPGTASSSAGWQIQKLTYSGDDVTDIKWAGGSLSFTNIFDNYASFTYS